MGQSYTCVGLQDGLVKCPWLDLVLFCPNIVLLLLWKLKDNQMGLLLLGRLPAQHLIRSLWSLPPQHPGSQLGPELYTLHLGLPH